MTNLIRLFLLIPAIIFGFVGVASAAPDAETAYIFNSFSFLVHGFLVMLMAAGFCMLESGLVTNKSVSTIAAKNMGKFAICSIIFFLFGNVVNIELLVTQLFIFQSLFNIVLVTLLKYLPKLSFSS